MTGRRTILMFVISIILIFSTSSCQKYEENESTKEANMKTIGLIGGMSWLSTAEYYRIINQEVNKREGGLHSAKIIMYSVDFDTIERMQTEGRWDEAANMLVDIARKLETGGADCIVICTNTMHRVADDVQKGIDIPLLNIVDATAERIKAKGLKKVGLLGTRYTMKEDFYRGRLSREYGIEAIVPGNEDINTVNNIIFKELCLGNINRSSKDQIIEIINSLADGGAEGVILGCTELPLLVKQEDVSIPLFDTTQIHAEYAVEYALRDGASKEN
jgi:aspartate racemase